MGKNWKYNRNKGKDNVHDLSSCRGHGVVIATCDVSREREASKELLNLIDQAIDTLHPQIVNISQESSISNTISSSIQNLLQQEIVQVQSKSQQNAVSIFTDIKGVVLVKLLSVSLDVISIVEEIFNRIEREGNPISRHLVRVIPLRHTFFPKNEELLLNCFNAMSFEYPGVNLPQARKLIDEYDSKKLHTDGNDHSTIIDTIPQTTGSPNSQTSRKRPRIDESFDEFNELEPTSSSTIDIGLSQADPSTILEDSIVNTSHVNAGKQYPPFTCELLFKARNHNVITKTIALGTLHLCLPTFGKLTYQNPEIHVVVEALKNLGGLSILRNYTKYLEYNIRKYQGKHTSKTLKESDVTTSTLVQTIQSEEVPT